jgi:acyl-CoA thioester hydrolase
VAEVFRTEYRVAWADTDAAGVVHFSRYFLFFERCEEEFYNFLGFSFKDIAEQGLWFPRVEAFCQYKKPARFNDLLLVELCVLELKEKSVRYGFAVQNKESGELLTSGHLVVVAADKKTGRATAIPRMFVDKLAAYVKQVL